MTVAEIMRCANLARKAAVAFLLLSLAIFVFGCWPNSNPELDGSTLNRGLIGDPESLDPHKISSNQSAFVLLDIGEGLTSYGADGAIIPGVADRWENTSDGLTYTFHLRQQARWSDGSAVTADDFEFAFKRLVDPETAAPYAQYLSAIENALSIANGNQSREDLSVVAIDKHTLQIRLHTPAPHFLQLVAHPSTFPLHQESFRTLGVESFKPGNYVSNGAYQLVDWTVGSSISLRRNEAYWASQTTTIDNVIFHIVDQNAEFNRYRAREIDVTANVPESALPSLRKERPSELRVAPYLGVYYYGFNLVEGLFANNLKLRQALSMAIDRQALVDQITGRGEIPAYSWVPPGVHRYSQQQYDFSNLEKIEREKFARSLFGEAGFELDQGLEFELRYNTFDGNERIALAIQSMWRDVLGVEAKLGNEELKVFIDNVRSRENIEAFRLSWTGDYNDAVSFLQLFKSNNPSNFTGYSSSNFDKTFLLAETEADSDNRKILLEKAERIAMADYPVIPLYFYVSKHLISQSVLGWENNVMDIHLSRHLSLHDGTDSP